MVLENRDNNIKPKQRANYSKVLGFSLLGLALFNWVLILTIPAVFELPVLHITITVAVLAVLSKIFFYGSLFFLGKEYLYKTKFFARFRRKKMNHEEKQ